MRTPIIRRLFAALLIAALSGTAPAAARGRIAISTDGDQADPDDWAATPMMLALLAKTGLQNRLIHVDYNNKFLIETKACEHYHVEMRKSTLGAAKTFGFHLNRLFDDQDPAERAAALNNLRREMLKSTVDDPLFIVVGGAYHFIYEAALPIQGQYGHVHLIQHSADNARNNQGGPGKNEADVLALGGFIETHIAGQGPTLNNLHLDPLQAGFGWLRDSNSTEYNYLFAQIQKVFDESSADPRLKPKSDISDSGMMLYLVRRLLYGEDLREKQFTPADFQEILGNSYNM